ncbi:hypothetical protein ILUMI_15909 [Ignelater luminosus]|uniref:Deoxyuridine 5'-triphosphate nucleotidohydrolase n=1 Tax=Ignelater luminosus TaxID=2038154 RepID=A0A8K0G8N6_IGNLU|nr:hypothetical protein ILUMI_15909 [Ignelater luminosus]
MCDPEKVVLKFEKTLPSASSLTRKTETSAGFDLKSAFDYIISKRSTKIIDTGIKVLLPDGCCGNIVSRFALAIIHSIIALRGVVHSSNETITVILFNHSDVPFCVKQGDSVAKLVCQQVFSPNLTETDESSLSETERAANGFGSTGFT